LTAYVCVVTGLTSQVYVFYSAAAEFIAHQSDQLMLADHW